MVANRRASNDLGLIPVVLSIRRGRHSLLALMVNRVLSWRYYDHAASPGLGR